MRQKKISAGVLIVDNENILLGHATLKKEQNGYDIFKGGRDENENYISTAIRELIEETGIMSINKSDLKDLGRFNYRPEKDLYLFMYKSYNIEEEFNIDKLFCFTMVPGKNYPEMDRFKVVQFDLIDYYMYKSLSPIIKKVLQNEGLIE